MRQIDSLHIRCEVPTPIWIWSAYHCVPFGDWEYEGSGPLNATDFDGAIAEVVGLLHVNLAEGDLIRLDREAAWVRASDGT